jgi:endonuclease III
MADNQIKIEISAGTEELIKALNSADKAAVKFSGKVVSSFAPIRTEAAKTGNTISDAFNKAFTDVAKGVAVGSLVEKGISFAFNAITSFVSGSITASAEQEAALNRLSQALKASGSFSKQAVDDFSAFASELQKTSVYADEVVVGQLAIAKSFGVTNEQAKNLVLAAANLTSTFGGSLEDNVSKLAKTLDGTAGKLNEQIPALRGLTAEQLKAGAALDVVNAKFAGAAANELNSYNGKIAESKNIISDFQEELGNLITQNSLTIASLSAVNSVFATLTGVVQDTNAVILGTGLNQEQQAAAVDTLSGRYAQLTTRIEAYQNQLSADAQGNLGFFDKLFFDADAAKKELISLQSQQAKLFDQINKVPIKSAAPVGGTGGTVQTEEEKAAAAKLVSDKEAVNQQLIQQQQDFNVYMSQLRLADDTLTQEQRALEYENLLAYEQSKITAVQEAELAKAQLIKDASLKKSTEDAINQKADLDRQKVYNKNKIDQEKELSKMQRQEADTRLAITSNFINAGLALTKEGSAAQKALSIASATVSTYTAATHALEDTRPAFLGPAVAASIVALGLANVAKIAGAKFATGGIVSGYSTSGDRVPALVNSGEMILNKNQQTELYGLATGSRSANGGSDLAAIISEIRNIPIIVQANGREIARLIRDEQKNGFEVFA